MGSQKKQTQIAEAIARELREGYGLSASFFRAAAARIEMTDTDMQVIDILENSGDSTAGQLAHLMGLTTGTFTAILNRLEKAGLVSRERDPNDGRRVIVKLATDGTPLFASLGKAWEEMTAQYTDEQKAFLLEFLQRSNALAKEEIARLRETSAGDEGVFSAPLADLESARLVFSSNVDGYQLRLRAGDLAGALYQAQFEGPVPDVKVKDSVVTIRHPQRLGILTMDKRAAEITLNTAIPWAIVIRSGGSDVTLELSDLDLLEMEANGAGSMFRVELPQPSGMVPIRLGGSGSEFTVRRPSGVAARVQLKGWGSSVTLDNHMVSNGRLQSPDYESASVHYDIETSGSGSMFTITAG
jgi:DNA-binding MarR family transcriptional regulator